MSSGQGHLFWSLCYRLLSLRTSLNYKLIPLLHIATSYSTKHQERAQRPWATGIQHRYLLTLRCAVPCLYHYIARISLCPLTHTSTPCIHTCMCSTCASRRAHTCVHGASLPHIIRVGVYIYRWYCVRNIGRWYIAITAIMDYSTPSIYLPETMFLALLYLHGVNKSVVLIVSCFMWL